MGMRSNDDRFFQTHTRVPFLDKEITVNPINIPTKVSCICPLILNKLILNIALATKNKDDFSSLYALA